MDSKNENAMTNVLVVDDNDVDRERVRRALQGGTASFQVFESSSLAEGIRMARQESIDIVVLDLRMQTTSGLETLAAFQSSTPTLPIVLLSGIADERLAMESLRLGVEDYIDKTEFESQWFRIILQNAIQRFETKQKMIQYSNRLERANADLENFAHFTSHDLQEPLRAIAGYSALLRKSFEEDSTERRDHYLSKIQSGAEQMRSLINDMLQYPTGSLDESDREVTDLNQSAYDAISNLSQAINESNAVLEIGDLPTVWGHPIRLTQLLQNLIANAIKYRRDDVSPEIQVFGEETETDFVISVRDNGIGIATEHQQDIFKIFNRLHVRSEYSGNGIGLAICQRVVEFHNGELSVESTVGSGTTFQVRLPKNGNQPVR